jgi:hypothetical protein
MAERSHTTLGPPASSHKSKAGAWLTPRTSKLMVGAISCAAIHVDALAEKALRKAWPSYALILLIQSKVIWRIWDIRDITSGDTSNYFATAKKWADGFLVDIVWSPLYTAFYGSFLFVTADAYNATMMHRVSQRRRHIAARNARLCGKHVSAISGGGSGVRPPHLH